MGQWPTTTVGHGAHTCLHTHPNLAYLILLVTGFYQHIHIALGSLFIIGWPNANKGGVVLGRASSLGECFGGPTRLKRASMRWRSSVTRAWPSHPLKKTHAQARPRPEHVHGRNGKVGESIINLMATFGCGQLNSASECSTSCKKKSVMCSSSIHLAWERGAGEGKGA